MTYLMSVLVCFTFFINNSFAETASGVDKVKVLVVKKEQTDLAEKKKGLEDNKCNFLGDFAVNIDIATSMIRKRKMTTVKEKCHEMKGNVVISSLENDGSLPPRLKGLVYKCPDSFLPQNDIDSI